MVNVARVHKSALLASLGFFTDVLCDNVYVVIGCIHTFQ